MARAPAFSFYPGDWLRNAALRRCTHAERGAWIDVMCLMHDADEYGILRWPLADVATAVGAPVKLLEALRTKGVLKGAHAGQSVPALIYVPRSGRRDGEPVTLIAEHPGPMWYSSRMVRDAYVRQIRGAATRFDDSPKAASKHSPKPPIGEESGMPKGDGLAFAFADPIPISPLARSAPEGRAPEKAPDPVVNFQRHFGRPNADGEIPDDPRDNSAPARVRRAQRAREERERLAARTFDADP